MITLRLCLLLSLICLTSALAVTPPPVGGYPGENTATGEDALFSLTSGTENTASGYHALHRS